MKARPAQLYCEHSALALTDECTSMELTLRRHPLALLRPRLAKMSSDERKIEY